MPVRSIPKNYNNVTGVAAHLKSSGKAMFESTLERDLLMLLEFDKSIKQFEVQPVKIEWTDALGKGRSYTPDVVAFSHRPKQRPILYEVKYRSDIKKNWKELKPKFKAAIRFCKQNHWQFKIITEVEIRTQYLESAKFLLPFVRRGYSTETDMTLLDNKLSELSPSTPRRLLEAIYSDEFNQATLLPTLWYLIGTGEIKTDLTNKVTMSSKIWLLGKKD